MAETRNQLVEWLEDLCVRFIINLPQEELESVERICFQVEEAQWFYEDFVRPLNPSLPSMSLKQFCLAIFRVCPLFSNYTTEQHLSAYSQFLAYKTRVPVRGAIMLNEEMDHVVLVKGWKKGANWSFPRGKINKDETDLDCAIREVYEETGYDIAAAGLVPDGSETKSIEVTMREQHMQLYVFRNVPMDTPFAARTRKEISKISWWKLACLPGYQKKKQKQQLNDEDGPLNANKLYMVAPFLSPLKQWIVQQRKRDRGISNNPNKDGYLSAADGQVTDGDAIGDDAILLDMPPTDIDVESSQLLHTEPELDAAGKMKQLLGVGLPEKPMPNQTPAQAPTHGGSHPQNLLALLQSDANPPQTAYQSTQQTDIQGVLHFPQKSQHLPQHPMPPFYSGIRTDPSLGLRQQHPSYSHQLHRPLPHINAGANVFGNNQMQHTAVDTNHHLAQHSQFQTSNSVPLSYMTSGLQDTLYSGAVQAHGDHHGPHAAPPYYKTGDPMAYQHSPDPRESMPTIPAASQLPQPRLSAHAASLLAAFKKPSSSRPAISASPTTASPQAPPAPHIGPLQTPEVPRLQPQPPSRTNSRQAFGGLIPSNVTPVSRRNSGANDSDLTKRKHTMHQETLLGLFKASSVPQSQAGLPRPNEFVTSPPPPRPNVMQPSSTQEKLLNLFNSTPGSQKEPSSSLQPQPANVPLPPSAKVQPEAALSNRDALLKLFEQPVTPTIDVSNQPTSKSPLAPPVAASVPIAPPSAVSASQKSPELPKAIPSSRHGENQEPLEAGVASVKTPTVLRGPDSTSRSTPITQNANSNVGTPAKTVEKALETGTVIRRKARQSYNTSTQEERPRTPTGPPIKILKRPANASTDPTPPQPTQAGRISSMTTTPLTPLPSDTPVIESVKSKTLPRSSPKSRSSTRFNKDDRPSTPSSIKTADKTSAKPAFQPQILRRPQQSPSASDVTLARPGEAIAPSKIENLDDSRQNLLTLFAQPKQSAPSLASSSVVTPRGSKSNTGLSKSRINSIASPSALLSPPRAGSFAPNGPGMTLGNEAQSGPRTPISSADKGFLMNYLEDVVKGVSR